MTAIVLELVPDPWAYCDGCGDGVDYRAAGRNMPCGCAAGVESVCPTWDAHDGCRCSAEQKAHQAGQARADVRDAIAHPGRLMVAPAGSWQSTDSGPELVVSSDPARTRVIDLRESGSDSAPRRELGDDVLDQGERWQVPVLIILAGLVVAVIVGTALVVG